MKVRMNVTITTSYVIDTESPFIKEAYGTRDPIAIRDIDMANGPIDLLDALDAMGAPVEFSIEPELA